MLEWLIPVSLYWIFGALFLGAFPIAIIGGNGLRQVIGLILGFVLYVGAWCVVRWALGGDGAGALARIVVPTAVTLVTFPLYVGIAYRLFGIRLARGAPVH